MKPLLTLLLVASAAFPQNSQPNVVNAKFETRAYSGNLDRDIQSEQPAWFGYAVKSIRNGDESCCWSDGAHGCWLENGAHEASGVRSNRPVPLEGSDRLSILVRVDHNTVTKIRGFSLSCPLDAGGLPFIWLTEVPPHASVSYLEHFANGSTPDRLADAAIFAIAQHQGPEADAVLAQLTRPSVPENIREKTTFWLGASRGAAGTALLKQILASDPSGAVRDKAVFALSISKQPDALDFLIQAANSDPSPHVRAQALFWLAQKAGKRASETITNAIQNDPDTEVKKKAVFALSQLPKDDGVPKLIEVAKTQRNPEVRKQAFFWLGQSQDPRALAFIEQVLVK
jgi:hypothetical protein